MHRTSFVALLFLCAILLHGCNRAAPTTPKLEDLNILLIVIDTLGARHLGVQYDGKSISPNIDELANNGVSFKNSYSSAPWTKPSIASLLTGLMPSQHQVKKVSSILDDSFTTLAEELKARGFLTAGRVSHTFLTAKHGFKQGFDDYRIVKFKGNVHHAVTSEKVSDGGIQWLQSNQDKFTKQRFFLFLHYFDPHYNYQHHAQFDLTSKYSGSLQPGMDIRELRKRIPNLTKEDLQYLNGLYHEEISYTDSQIGRVIQFIKDAKLSDNTLVILTADHGEEFMEHDWIGHTRTLYNELIQVPLIFSLPKVLTPRLVEEPVSTSEVFSTILNLDSSTIETNSLRRPGWMEELFHSKPFRKDHTISFEVDFNSTAIKAYKAGILQSPFKLIYDKPTKQFELFNLEKDPFELNAEQTKGVKEFPQLRSKLEYVLKNQGESLGGSTKEIKTLPEETEQLKSLGYL